MKYLVLAFAHALVALCVTSVASAQEQSAPTAGAPSAPKVKKERTAHPEGVALQPGRTMKPSKEMKLAASYADSNEFKKAFADLYSIIKPKVTIKERAEKIFTQTSRTFARTGVDSAKAYEATMKSVDPKLDHEIIYTTYRAALTAEELKGWVSFLKTPAGKKILEVGDKLLAADDQKIESQVRRAVNTAIAPLRQPAPPKENRKPEGSIQMNAPSGGSASARANADGSAEIAVPVPAVPAETPAPEKK